AEHAVAGVEHHAETDRYAFVGELRHLLWVAVLEDIERLTLEPGHQASLTVAHGRGDAGNLDARSEHAAVADDRVLCGERGGEDGRPQQRTQRSTHILS